MSVLMTERISDLNHKLYTMIPKAVKVQETLSNKDHGT